MSAKLGACCAQGAIHDGESSGTFQTIGGIEKNYVAVPKGDYDKTQALLFLPDVFGTGLKNAQLLADSFACNGIYTVIVEYLNGDEVAPNAMTDKNSGFDIQEWFKTHGQSDTRPPLDAVIKGLKEQGVKKFAATGYCYGGRYVVDLALDHEISVAVVAHPSLLKVPDDLQAIKDKSSDIPFFWNTAEKDYMFNTEAAAKLEEIFKGEKNYKHISYPDCEHGYAVRGDLSIPAVKAGKEKTFEETVKFIKANL